MSLLLDAVLQFVTSISIQVHHISSLNVGFVKSLQFINLLSLISFSNKK
ncbi:hypothetical protein [Vibrio gallaecicus]|nr:hypothetical protein [Vibrio gallaecicus]MDN3615294.1 hypothetical protein [Vibrio gallaecicus]